MIEQLLMRDDSNYILFDDLITLLNKLHQEYPELVQLSSIGESYERRQIPLMTLSLNKNATTALALTGAHHSRELSSIQLPLLAVLKFLHAYEHGQDQDIILALENFKILVIPAVNVDGYKLISDYFNNDTNPKSYVYKRKNNNQENSHGDVCQASFDYEVEIFADGDSETFNIVSQGVDLNRNYDWDFGNGTGSSDDPCAQDYRGPFPFSEPETRAMRDFIQKYQGEIKIIYNMHTYGNLFVHPFSHKKNSGLEKSYPRESEIYQEIWKEGGFPQGNTNGNAYQTVGYMADGEASDWIFGNYKIIAASPELGLLDANTYNFFIDNRTLILDLLNQNYPWIRYSFLKLGTQLGFSHTSTNFVAYKKGLEINLSLLNKGFQDFQLDQSKRIFTFEIESQVLSQLEIDGSETLAILKVEQTNNRNSFKVTCQISGDLKSREKYPFQVRGKLAKRIWYYDQDQEILKINHLEYPQSNQIKNHIFKLQDISNQSHLLQLMVEDKERGALWIDGSLILAIILIAAVWIAKKKDQKVQEIEKVDIREDLEFNQNLLPRQEEDKTEMKVNN